MWIHMVFSCFSPYFTCHDARLLLQHSNVAQGSTDAKPSAMASGSMTCQNRSRNSKLWPIASINWKYENNESRNVQTSFHSKFQNVIGRVLVLLVGLIWNLGTIKWNTIYCTSYRDAWMFVYIPANMMHLINLGDECFKHFPHFFWTPCHALAFNKNPIWISSLISLTAWLAQFSALWPLLPSLSLSMQSRNALITWIWAGICWNHLWLKWFMMIYETIQWMSGRTGPGYHRYHRWFTSFGNSPSPSL